MGEGLTFSPAWILKDTPRTASGSSGRCLSPKSRNSIWPPRGQGDRAAQAGSVQGAWGRRGTLSQRSLLSFLFCKMGIFTAT